MDKNNLPKLDRLVQFDERSRGFRAVEGIEDEPLRSKSWRCDIYNDQGTEGACVGFAWSHELSAKPIAVPTDDETALEIYNRARQLDPWEGEDYSGTSVLAGVQALQELHINKWDNPLVREYRWAFGAEDVLRTLAYTGPVVLGIEWQESMYYPESDGFLQLDENVVGGHAILAKAVNINLINSDGGFVYSNLDKEKTFITLHNSWGTGYGIGGNAFLRLTDLEVLLDRDGEACIPTRRAVNK